MSQSKGERRLEAGNLRSCPWCRKDYRPSFRLKERQKTCGDELCRKIHKREFLRQWRNKNPEVVVGYQQDYGKKPQGFWPKYRDAHPKQTERNREQSKLRARLKRQGLQRNLDIAQAVETPIKAEAFVEFAKIHRKEIGRAFGKPNTS